MFGSRGTLKVAHSSLKWQVSNQQRHRLPLLCEYVHRVLACVSVNVCVPHSFMHNQVRAL